MYLHRLMTAIVSRVFCHDELLCGGYVSLALDLHLVFPARHVRHSKIPMIVGEDVI